jgi:hypothetical protein
MLVATVHGPPAQPIAPHRFADRRKLRLALTMRP